jgi:NAD(P)H-hydrate repair Nnr-like enzyme with NAD(P)H-hydrate epimerase domain
MQPVLNVEDVRRVEEELTKVGVSVSELMHRAGSALAHEVLRMGRQARLPFSRDLVTTVEMVGLPRRSSRSADPM